MDKFSFFFGYYIGVICLASVLMLSYFIEYIFKKIRARKQARLQNNEEGKDL